MRRSSCWTRSRRLVTTEVKSGGLHLVWLSFQKLAVTDSTFAAYITDFWHTQLPLGIFRGRGDSVYKWPPWVWVLGWFCHILIYWFLGLKDNRIYTWFFRIWRQVWVKFYRYFWQVGGVEVFGISEFFNFIVWKLKIIVFAKDLLIFWVSQIWR